MCKAQFAKAKFAYAEIGKAMLANAKLVKAKLFKAAFIIQNPWNVHLGSCWDNFVYTYMQKDTDGLTRLHDAMQRAKDADDQVSVSILSIDPSDLEAIGASSPVCYNSYIYMYTYIYIYIHIIFMCIYIYIIVHTAKEVELRSF